MRGSRGSERPPDFHPPYPPQVRLEKEAEDLADKEMTEEVEARLQDVYER